MRLFLFFCLSISFGQCSSSKNKTVKPDDQSVMEEPRIEEEPAVVVNTDSHPCFPGREKLKSFENQEATIVTIIGRPMLVFDYTRLDPCEIPKEFTKNDLKVIVSGDTYATPPNVRVAGQPFVIRNIKLAE